MAIDEIVSELHENGIYKFQTPFIRTEEIKRLRPITREVLKKSKDEYLFGDAARIGRYESWNPSPIYDILSKPLIHSIAAKFYNSPPSFNEIFLTHEYKNDAGMERNGFLHFDRIPTLKFFFYLSDCNRKNGAFHYVPGSYKIGTQLRTAALARTDEYGKIQNRLEIDYPDLGITKKNAVPLEGPVGTMFIFHTDLFHYGGTVSDDSEREIMRLHFRNI